MRLFRLNYSPYCLKVEKAFSLVGAQYEPVDVPYLNRAELVEVTGGYIQVPVLVDPSGKVHTDSRAICEFLVNGPSGEKLVPRGLEAAVWAYHDWCDNQLEDVLFRIASPRVAKLFPTPQEGALFVFIKERKFGKGCVQSWEKDTANLIQSARALLAPTEKTLSERRFIFGDSATLGDAALYGNLAMLDKAGIPIEKELGTVIGRWFQTMKP